MTPTTFVRHGVDPITQTPLFIAEFPSFSVLKKPELPAKPLKLFIAGDADKLSTEDIGRIAEAFLQQGVRYVCTWGTDCERVHDIFDEMYVGEGNEPYKFDLMTTWHANDSFGEALWFFLNAAHVEDEIEGTAAFAVQIGNPPNSAPLSETIQRIEEFLSD
jgi:hypothetical protein